MSKKHIRFSFPKPEKGIVECLLTVEAEDEGEAVEKLALHMIELQRGFCSPPMPIGKSADPGTIGNELMRRLTLVTEPMAYIVTLHLFVEHWLNQILLKFCPNHDLTRYDFFKKLEIVHCIDKIPKSIFQNLSKLNDLRNTVAHKPDYDLTKMNLSYLDSPPGFQLPQSKPSYAPSPANHIFNVLNGVMCVTYGLLHNHCMQKLGFGAAKKDKEQTAKS